jgi:hypothetical protein
MPAANAAGNPKSQNPNTQSKLKFQISNQSRSDPLGFGRLKFRWDLDFGIWDFTEQLLLFP